MKQALVLLTVTVAACGGSQTQPNDTTSQDRLLNPQQVMEARTHTEIAALHTKCNTLLDIIKGMDRRIKQLEAENEQLRVAVARIESDWAYVKKQAEKQGPAPGPNGTPEPPKETTTAAPRPSEDKTKLIVESIAKLKRRMDTPEARDIGDQLKPLAKEAAPRLIAELRDNAMNLAFQKNVKEALSRFPTDALKDLFVEGLRDHRLRLTCAEVVGIIGDTAFSAVLDDSLGTQDEEFRLVVGEALVRCKRAEGVPLLIATLRSDQESYRFIAIRALKKLKGNDTMGYDYTLDRDSTTNKNALARWEKWWDENKDKLFKE